MEYKGMDNVNLKRMTDWIKDNKIIKGLTGKKEHIIAAVLRIKPIHTIGYQIKDSLQISKYWLKEKNQEDHNVKYVYESNHIITDLLKRISKLPNEELLLALLCGH